MTKQPAGMEPCSPRTRGWSHLQDAEDQREALLPAHAGMVPYYERGSDPHQVCYRARGNGPSAARARSSARSCSPRTRGWSRRHSRPGRQRHLLPAQAGWSPEGDEVARSQALLPARGGWSRRHQERRGVAALLPAHP
jgi:hypothetical protein